jgi:HlyD family secretion protein
MAAAAFWKRWRGRLVGAAVALLIVAGLVYAFLPQPVPVDLAAVSRGPLMQTVDEEGRTRVRERYLVSAPIAGRLRRVDLKAGDAVTRDVSVVATIQPAQPAFLDVRTQREAEAAVKAAEAAVALAESERDRARAELKFAEDDLVRARGLAADDNIARRTLERTEMEARTRRAALAAADAQLQVRRFELETARARLTTPEAGDGAATSACCLYVTAPVSGKVLRVLQESESVVSAGMPLLEIGDPQELEIVVDLLSEDAVRVSVGDEVIVHDWGGAAPLAGTVRRIEPYGFEKVSALGIEEQRVNTLIDLLAPPPEGVTLGDGFRVQASIIVWRGENVLQVPAGALFRVGADWAVYLVQDGRAVLRGVSVGHVNATEAEVLEGLADGDRVVLHPSDRIGDGVAIEPRPNFAAAPTS